MVITNDEEYELRAQKGLAKIERSGMVASAQPVSILLWAVRVAFKASRVMAFMCLRVNSQVKSGRVMLQTSPSVGNYNTTLNKILVLSRY